MIAAALVQQIVDEMRMPALSLYGGDWLRDPVSSCSIAAQGLWFRLLLTMHDAKPYGHLVGNNGQPLSEKAVARSCSVTVDQLRRLRAELEEVGVPGRTNDRDYDPIFRGDINGEDIDFSPLRIATAGVIYSRRLIKDQRIRVIRRLVAILGTPKRGRLTGQTLDQNAERDARGRAANDNDGSPVEQLPENRGEGAGEGRPLTGSQQAVKSVEDALEEHTVGFAIPDPRRIAKEIKTFGVDFILSTISGSRGSLDHKSWNYLHQILESNKRRPHERTTSGADRRRETSGSSGAASGTPHRTAASFGNKHWRDVLAEKNGEVPALPDGTSGGSSGDLP